VTDTPRAPDPDAPPPVAGERRLDRAPSERYRSAPVAPPPAEPSDTPGGVSAARGVAFGAIAAIAGAGLIVLLGGAMAVSAGLLVAAAAIGYGVALAIVTGAGDTLSRSARSWIAAVLAGLGVLVGQLGLWLFARTEGGVLPLVDYLGETFGVLVPLELVLAAGLAWWRAR
jgi:hypothetical protein